MNNEILLIMILVILAVGLLFSRYWQKNIKRYIIFALIWIWLGEIIIPIHVTYDNSEMENIKLELRLINKRKCQCDPNDPDCNPCPD